MSFSETKCHASESWVTLTKTEERTFKNTKTVPELSFQQSIDYWLWLPEI